MCPIVYFKRNDGWPKERQMEQGFQDNDGTPILWMDLVLYFTLNPCKYLHNKEKNGIKKKIPKSKKKKVLLVIITYQRF